MEHSGYGKDGIYRSLRPPLILPNISNLSMVSFLFNNISSYPQHPALIDSFSGEILSFTQFKSMVVNLSHSLIQLGIQKGHVVLIYAPNSIHYPVTFLGILAAGAIATTVNPVYTISEIKKQVDDCKPKLIVTVPELWDKVKDLNLPGLILGEKDCNKVDSSSKIVYFSELINGCNVDFPNVRIKQNDTAALLYSSGTTGVSKGVILTHKNFIAAALMILGDQEFEGVMHEVYICVLPMFHVFGLSVLLCAQLQKGNTVVCMPKFDFELMLKAIEKYRVTKLWVVPPIMLALAKHSAVKKYDLSSLKYIGSGAAPLGKEMMLECSKNVPQATIMQGYGMTETCGIISVEHPRLGGQLSGSTGMLVAGQEAKIIQVDTSNPLPPNQLGEIWIRGPNVMKGYLNNPQATKLTIDDKGWLHTGDLGYFDEKGQLYVVDRLKELIKYKGFQVAPAELEAVLISHPEILDAAVIPFPDDEAGEVPIAFVVRSPKCDLKEDDVMKFVADQRGNNVVVVGKTTLECWKLIEMNDGHLDIFVRKATFVSTIPKSASGKLLRRELIEMSQSKL